MVTVSVVLSHNLAQLHVKGKECLCGAENCCPNLREEAFRIKDLRRAESFAT
jgi:hypothetical protein